MKNIKNKRQPLFVYFILMVAIFMTNPALSVASDNTNKEGKAITVTIHTNQIINDGYIGNGPQWDPYQLDYGHGRMEISEADWQKMYNRLDFMQPHLMRVMTNTSAYIKDGKFDPESNLTHLTKILGYCQKHGITVVFGDWGWSIVNPTTEVINAANMNYAAQLVKYLIDQKGYTCIKYYNMVNEPNGHWSSVKGSYSLWAKTVIQFHEALKKQQMANKISIVGPDAAIWTEEEAWWADSCATHLKDIIDLYDIHTYPSKTTVNSGKYTDIIKAYEHYVPKGKKIIMGEIGLKFVDPADSLYLKENNRRINATPYASRDDSQMFVYDHLYGIDMADAVIQTANAGYSGSVAWMLDDAMYSKGKRDQLKIWGFWNIFGEEFFGADQELVRPWFYSWSLLSKYMPNGSKVYRAEVTGDKDIKAIAVEKDGRYMIGLVNISDTKKNIVLDSKTLNSLANIKQFIYAEGIRLTEGDCTMLPNKKNVTLNLKKGTNIEMPKKSFIVYTNFDY